MLHSRLPESGRYNNKINMHTANIQVCCPDKPGIVKTITEFLFQHGANITILEQHIEDEFFFMRVEWELEKFKLRQPEKFWQNFEPIKKNYNIIGNLDYNQSIKSVGLFCSRELHCLVDILARYELGELKIKIPYIISNYLDAQGIAGKFDIPFFHIPTNPNSHKSEQECLKIIRQYPTDLIALARYMKILSADFIQEAQQKIINVHHSFLPSFIGADPYYPAFQRGVKLIGASAHYVTADLDQGPIIEQNVQRIKHIHNVQNLKLIGRECEKEVFAFAIKKHIQNKIITFKNRTIVFE